MTWDEELEAWREGWVEVLPHWSPTDGVKVCVTKPLGMKVAFRNAGRFWTMLAHAQGGLLNQAALARSLAVDGKTIASYLDLPLVAGRAAGATSNPGSASR